MPKINLDGIEYNTEDLSDNGKAQVASLQFIEYQVNRIKSQIQIYNTAKQSYVKALKAALESPADEEDSSSD